MLLGHDSKLCKQCCLVIFHAFVICTVLFVITRKQRLISIWYLTCQYQGIYFKYADKKNKMISKANLRFNTFNTRGLGDRLKRKVIFSWLQEHQKGITFLQETHSTLKDEKLWCNDWGNQILFSHGTSKKGGVAILFSPDVQVDIKKCVADDEGRILLIDITVEDHDFILCNIYAPTKDKAKEQQSFLIKLKDMLTPYIDRDLFIGGDFNICQFPEIDKKGGVLENQLPFAKEIISFKEEFQL